MCTKPVHKLAPEFQTLSSSTLSKDVEPYKVRWVGTVVLCCSLALITLTSPLQGTVKGERRQGRERKRWEDNIREWTGPEFVKSQRAVENREKWRKLVAKSSVVPQRPLRLRD